jgi:hypothetical protein
MAEIEKPNLVHEQSPDPQLHNLKSEALQNDAALPAGTIDPVYEKKARVLNHAIQEIGMGWYQWQVRLSYGLFVESNVNDSQLFIVVGFGWANDNMLPIVTSLICMISMGIHEDALHLTLVSSHTYYKRVPSS